MALSFFVFFLLTGPEAGLSVACAQGLSSGNDVQARMNRIENEIQTLSRAIFRGESLPPEMMASMQADQAARSDLERRLDALENELRTLTGRIEEQGFALNTLSQKVEKNLVDIGMRLNALEQRTTSAGSAPAYAPPPSDANMSSDAGMPPAPSAVPAPETPSGGAGFLGQIMQRPDGTPGSAPPSDADPATQYERAFTALRSGNYPVAESQFEAFLAQNPKHSLAPNAKYWLGESYYARKDYEKSARTFAEAYQQYPKSPKTPDNLLKLAMSLAGMGNKTDACVAFAQLRREYPDGTGPVLVRADQESKKLGCP